LIAVIVTLVLFAALATGMLKLDTTSLSTAASSNLSRRAYYMAESGYRYAASQFLHAGDGLTGDALVNARDDMLTQLHTTGSFDLEGRQGFDLDIAAYYYDTYGTIAGGVLSAAAIGRLPFTSNIASSGYLKIGDTKHDYTYTGISVSGSTLGFSGISDTGTIPSATRQKVFPVCRSSAGTVSQGSSLYFQSNTGAAIFPPKNGKFRVNGAGGVYNYETLDLASSRLTNVRRSDNPSQAFSMSVTANDYIVAERFATMAATGRVGEGHFAMAQDVNYSFALVASDTGSSSSDGQAAPDYPDTLDNKDNLDERSGHGWGNYEIASVGGDSALHVTDLQGGGNNPKQEGIVGINIPNFQQAWQTMNHFLSYDVQVKIKVSDEPYYLDGISFRLTETGTGQMDYLAVSYMKTRTGSGRHSSDGIPDSLYINDGPTIVLWKLTGHGNNSEGRTVLAYKVLSSSKFVVDNSGYLTDWSTLVLRLEEKGESGTRYNLIKVYYADPSAHGTAGSSLTDDGRLAYPRNMTCQWPVEKAADLTAANDFFTQVAWDWVTSSDASVTSQESNTIVKITGWNTNFGTWPSDRPEVGLHTYGSNYESVYFDDLCLTFPGGGYNYTPPPGFQEPIQG